MVLCCTIHISRLAWPRSVPAPSRIQTPDNCPPQLLPHAPAPSYPKYGKKSGTCQISAICHARCVCNLDIFCPLSHRQPRQVKTCQPGRLRWSIFSMFFKIGSKYSMELFLGLTRILNYFKTQRRAVQRMLKKHKTGTYWDIGGIPL